MKEYTAPYSWKNLNMILDNARWDSLTRYPPVQEAYNDHLVDIINPKDYVKSVEMGNRDYYITQNPYPYWLKEVYHFLGWYDRGYQPQIQEAISHVFTDYNYRAEINPDVANRSVPHLGHYHIFVKRKAELNEDFYDIQYKIDKLFK